MKHLGLAVAAAAMAAVAWAMPVDGIVARVDSDTILRSEVLNEMARIGRNDGETAAKVIDELIARKLILKAAREQKMTMQEWVIENRIREIIARAFGGDRNRLMDQLAKERIAYPEWYARIKEDMIVSAMRFQWVDKNIIATPSAIREEYAANPEKYSEKSGKVSVSILLLGPDETDRADSVSFDTDADVYTNVLPEEVFLPDVCEAIKSLEKGEESEWLEIKGHHFKVRKDGEEIGRMKTLAEAYSEVEAAVRERAAKELYDEWIKRLRAASYVRVY